MTDKQTKLVFARISDLEKEITSLRKFVQDPNSFLVSVTLAKHAEVIEAIQKNIATILSKLDQIDRNIFLKQEGQN
jgi:hypothetical protein